MFDDKISLPTQECHHIKLFKFYVILLPFLLPLLQVDAFLLNVFLFVSSLPRMYSRECTIKVSQECTIILQMKVYKVCVVWKLGGHPPKKKCPINLALFAFVSIWNARPLDHHFFSDFKVRKVTDESLDGLGGPKTPPKWDFKGFGKSLFHSDTFFCFNTKMGMVFNFLQIWCVWEKSDSIFLIISLHICKSKKKRTERYKGYCVQSSLPILSESKQIMLSLILPWNNNLLKLTQYQRQN